MAAMSEALAHRLKHFCRVSLVAGTAALLWLYLLVRRAETHRDLPFELESGLWFLLLLAVWLGLATLLSFYLMVFMGVDVLGLNRLFGVPTGKPFGGLQPGEEERLRFEYTRGGIGWLNFNGVFKVRLTNQRLLAGANLTSWHLLEAPLEQIIAAEVRTRRWLPPALHLTQVGSQGTEGWALTLHKKEEFERLLRGLEDLGVPIHGRAGPSARPT
jgi:hypothetical protein